MADKSLTIFDRLLGEEEKEEKPETIFDRLLREEGEREEKEERYKEAELTSQPLPVLPPATKEEEKGWEEKTEADRILASEWYGTAKEHDKEEAERKHRERQLQFVPDFIELRKQGKVLGDRAMALMKLTPEEASNPPEVISDIDPLLLSLIVSSKSKEEREKRVDSVMDKENLGFFNKTKDFKEKSGLDFDHFGMTKQQLKERKSGIQRRAAASRTKVSARKEPNIYQKWRSLESTRSLLGPEPSVFMELYKPMGNKIDRLGLIPAAFEPGEGAKEAGEYLKIAPKEGRGTAASTGAALWNTAVGLGEVVLGSPGGAATIGLGGALTKAGKIRQMYEAERVLALGETAFAIDLARNAAEHAPGLMNDLKNPDLSEQEKLEMVFGEAALLVFSGMSGAKAKKNFKKKYGVEPDKIKTREQALTAYEKFLDQAARDALDPKLRKTPKQIQEAQIESLIKEMQDKVDRGEFRVPRPEQLEKDLPTPKLKAEEPPTPVEAEAKIRIEVEKAAEGKSLEDFLMKEFEVTFEELKGNDPKMYSAEQRLLAKIVKEHGIDLPVDLSDVSKQKILDKIWNEAIGKAEDYEARTGKPSGAEEFAWKLAKDEAVKIRSVMAAMTREKAPKPPTPVEAGGLDVAYDRAVKAGDRVAQKALVDEAAKAAGYDSGVVFHATPFKFTEFDRAKIARADADTNVSGFFFSKKPHVRAAMAQGSVERGPRLPENRIISSYLKLGRTTTRANAESIISKKAGEWFLDKDGNPKSLEELKAQGGDRIGNPPSDFYWPEGFDSVKFSKDTWIVRDPSQIKAAADIVRDNAGNVIPLSERFGLKAPKPPSKGYLEPPATALEATKRDAAAKAAAAKAGEGLETLGKKMEDIYPRGVAEGQKEALPEAMERVIREQTLKELIKEQNVPALEEFMKGEKAPPSTEGLTKAPRTEEQMIKAAEREAAEIDAAKAVKDEAKIEEAVEIAKETKEVGEEKIAEAAEGEMFPSAGTARKFHTTILRAKELARKEKDLDFIRRFDVNPDSAYFTVPTSRWARTIDTFDLATADTALAEYGATKGVMRIGDPQEIVGSLIKGRKQQLLLEKANKTGEKGDRQAYEDFVQTLANDRTFVGQMMQTYSFFKVSDPVAVRDVYQKAITEAGGPKLTVEEQGTLLDMIKKVEETRKKSEELAEIHRDAELNSELSEAEINKAFEKANDAMLDWERAVVEQINLVGDKTPKLAVDMIVAQWQGNFLTPTTHAVNVSGNIFPMAPRAAARTGSRVFEAADRFLWAKSREMKLRELEKLQEKSPDPIRGETIKRLQQLTDPMEQSKLIPERFLHLYGKATTSGTGAERVWSAWKAMRGKEGGKDKLEAFMKEFKRFKTPVGGDMLSSIVMGSDVNLYETGTMNMSNITRPADAFRAWQRLFGGKKSSKNVETVSKDIFEATFGMPPTLHFKGLMAGDVIFRNKEMMRLIDEQAAVRKWSPEKRARAIRNPKLMFTEKEMAQLRDRAAKASFQHETGWTEGAQKFHELIRSKGAAGEAVYLGWREQTPFMKTLMNVTHELFQFSPFGTPYTMGRGGVSGLRGAWRGYREEGAKGIPRGIQESYMPTKENLQIAGKNLVGLSIAMGAYKWLREDGIVSPDMNPVMSDPTDTAKVRYLTEETFHHGFINMSGLRRKFDNEDARWKEGDWVVDARRLGPIGHMLLSGAAVQRGLEKMPEKERRKIEADWDKLIAHELTGSAVYANRYFWNQTMASGVKDFVQSLWWIKEGKGSGKLGKKMVKDFTSIFLPNTAQWLTKVDSPYKQSFKPSTKSEQLKIEWDTKSRSMFDRSRMEKVRVRDEKGKVLEEDVPVGLTGYPIIVDLWGSPLETMGEGRVLGVPLASWKTATWEKTAQGREDFWDRFMAKTFNVVDFKKSGKIADPYSGEVYRLMMKTGKGDVVPPMYSNEITVGEGKDKRRYRLNQDQYAYKSIMEGRYRLEGVGEVVVSGARQKQRRWDTKGGWGFKQYMESSQFERASDEEKIRELQRIYKRARLGGVAALVDVGLMDEKSVRADLAMRKFNINPDNITLTDDQLIEEPSGMRE